MPPTDGASSAPDRTRRIDWRSPDAPPLPDPTPSTAEQVGAEAAGAAIAAIVGTPTEPATEVVELAIEVVDPATEVVEPAPTAPSAGPAAMSTECTRRVVATVAGVAAYALWAVLRWWQAGSGRPGVWQDTAGYVAQARRSLGSIDFWAGRRAPGLPLLIRATGEHLDRVVQIQTGIALAAWALLAWSVGTCIRPGWRRWIASGLVLAFACTRPVVQWDRQILTESLALSGLALVTAALLWFVRRPHWVRGVALVVACVLWVSVRDTDAVVVALLGVVLAVVGVVLVARRPRVVEVLVVGIVLVVVGVAGQVGATHGDRGVGPTADVFAARILPFPARLQWMADHGMPQAGRLRELAADARQEARAGKAVVVPAFPGDADLRAYGRWLRDDGQTALLSYVVLHPEFIVQEPFADPGRDFNNLGRWSAYVASERDLAPLGAVLFPPWPWVALEGAVGVVLVLLARRRTLAWPTVFGWTAAWAALGGLHLLVAWHGDAQEVTRHILVPDVQIRITALLALAWGIDGITRRARSDATAAPVEVSVDPGTTGTD